MRTLLAVVALTTLVVACGGDGGTAELSSAAFVREGDAVCADLEEAADAIEEPADESDFARYLRALLAAGADAHAAFEDLDPPADGDEVHRALLGSLDAMLEGLDGAATAAEGGDTVTAEDLLSQAAADGEAADEQARAYGFEVCGS